NRRLYREKFARADARLGGLPGYSSPEAGFFLWLAVEDGEAAALSLWKNHGVRVLPGAYLSREGDPAIAPGNPGAGFIRAALVAQGSEIERGLEALAATLETQGRNPG
ncbi:MAG: aspartate aminotransferase, partial [Rubricella sp.]